ncbi:MAG: TIGR01777 family oxidoreductase [Bacteroidota bacterium]
MKNILIAGGSGLVGKRLTQLLQQKGYTVAWLSREAKAAAPVQTFTWDIKRQLIHKAAFQFADAVINLAGAGVVEKRWTSAYKKEIYDSRIQSTSLLVDYIAHQSNHVEVLVNASAIGIYGNDFDKEATEGMEPAHTFLAKVCRDWEAAASQSQQAGVRTVFIRTGIVLSENEGFIGQLKTPIQWYAGTALGSGAQLTSWIHIDDLCAIYINALENERMSRAYNAVAPVPVTNKQLTHLLAKELNRSIILPNAPAFALKIALGEMADMLIGSQPVSSQKITDTGFVFKFAQAREAIHDLLSKGNKPKRFS